MKEICLSDELVEKCKTFLGEEGLKFFNEIKTKYGRVDASFDEWGIIHRVHYQEGCQVRAFLRSAGYGNDKDLETLWIDLVEKCLESWYKESKISTVKSAEEPDELLENLEKVLESLESMISSLRKSLDRIKK